METAINLKKSYLTDAGKFPPMINSVNYLTHCYKGEGVFGSLYKIGEELPLCVNVDSAFLADKTKPEPPVPKPPVPKPPAPNQSNSKKQKVTVADMRGGRSKVLFSDSHLKTNELKKYYEETDFLVISDYGEITLFFKNVTPAIKTDSENIGMSVNCKFVGFNSFAHNKTKHIARIYPRHIDFFKDVLEIFTTGYIDSVNSRELYAHFCDLFDVICKFVSDFIDRINENTNSTKP